MSIKRFPITIDKFILNECSRAFLFILMLFIALALIIVLFEDVDVFMKYDASLPSAILYVVLRVPHMVLKASPIIVVIASVVTFVNLNRNNEILMLYIAGYSPPRIIAPVLAALSVLIGVLFILHETVAAPGAERAHLIMETQIRSAGDGLVSRGGIWMHGSQGQVYRAGKFIPSTNTIENLDIFEFNGKNQTLSRRLHAETSEYNPQKGAWDLYDVVDHHFLDDGSITRDYYAQHAYFMETTPEDFGIIVQDPEEMSYADIRDIVKNIQRAGENPRVFLSHMRIKEAFPFAVFFLGTAAIALILRYGLTSTASGTGLGLVACIVYFLFLSLGKSFSDSGAIPAWLGAWTPNLICLMITAYLFWKLRHEI